MPRLLPGGERLSGSQSTKFQELLLTIFPSTDMFDIFLSNRLGINRQAIALGDDLTVIVYRAVMRAEAESWTAELLQAARAARPRDIPLFEFAQQFGLAPAAPLMPALERMIRASNSMLDIVSFRTQIANIEGQVCQITVAHGGTASFGTGFLVGPALVMTNYHVIEPLIKGEATPNDLICTFDYKALLDGTSVYHGTKYGLDIDHWYEDLSEYSLLDMQANAYPNTPNPDQLDYAILRLATSAGNDRIGGYHEGTNVQARGWLKVPKSKYNFTPHTALFIVQYPHGLPLKLALDTDSIIGLNGNGTRVRYRTNTDEGSSGSPCFDANWNLVALHHVGDPDYAELHRPEYNQGVPFTAIQELLVQRNKAELLA